MSSDYGMTRKPITVEPTRDTDGSVDPHRATVIGLDRKSSLRGVTMTSPDIRAGVSLLIAALSAEGKSTIHNIDQIDRGYQHIDERLRSLGANIVRV